MKIYDVAYGTHILKTCDECERVLDTTMDLHSSSCCGALFCSIKCAQRHSARYLKISKTDKYILQKEGYVLKDE